MREIRDGHIASESGGGNDSDYAGAGTEFQDPRRVVRCCEDGGERAVGRVDTVAVEEGDERGGGGPELKGETL